MGSSFNRRLPDNGNGVAGADRSFASYTGEEASMLFRIRLRVTRLGMLCVTGRPCLFQLHLGFANLKAHAGGKCPQIEPLYGEIFSNASGRKPRSPLGKRLQLLQAEERNGPSRQVVLLEPVTVFKKPADG